jgi:hypothetical protein
MIINATHTTDQNVSECVTVWCAIMGLKMKSISGNMEAQNNSGRE